MSVRAVIRGAALAASLLLAAGALMWSARARERRDAAHTLPSQPGAPAEALVLPPQEPSTRLAFDREGAKVRILDAHDETPIEGAQLALELDEGRAEATTDAHGLAVLPRGQRWRRLIARAAGYFPECTTDLRGPIEEEGILCVELVPAGTLTVRVLCESDVPVAGAFVRVSAWDPERHRHVLPVPFGWPRFARIGSPAADRSEGEELVSLTDASGTFVVRGLPVGRTLLVEASGTVTECSAHATIGPGTDAASVTLRGRTTAEITGRVVWEDGAPAAGIMVEIDPPIVHGMRSTAEDGSYRFAGAALRGYVLRVPSQRASVEVFVDQARVTAPDLRLRRTVRLSGTLLWGASELPPRFGDRLLVRASAERFLATTLPADDGSFELEVPPGAIVVQVLSPRRELLWSRTLEAPAEPLRIELASSSGLLIVRFEPESVGESARIQLFVPAVDSHTGRAAGVVEARLEQPSDGEVILAGIDPGAYHVLLITMEDGGSWSEPVRVQAGAVTEVALEGPYWGRITGRLRSSRDGAGFEIRTLDPADDVATTRSGPGGAFELERLLPGPHLVYALMPAASPTRGMSYLELGRQPAVVQLAIPDSGTLTGVVRRDGEPIEGVLVYCIDDAVPDATGAELAAPTDAAGRFSLGPLPIGAHEIVFQDPAPGRAGVFIDTHRIVIADSVEQELVVEWSASTSVVVREGSGALAKLQHARVFAADGRSLAVRPDALGRLPLGELACPCVIQACVYGGDIASSEGAGRDSVFAVLASLAPGEVEARVGSAKLEVGLTGAGVWPWPPLVRVQSVAGIRVDYAGVLPALRRRCEPGGVFVFDGVPSGTEVELSCPGADGGVARRITLDGEGSIRLDAAPSGSGR